jgi:hypothetical protein
MPQYVEEQEPGNTINGTIMTCPLTMAWKNALEQSRILAAANALEVRTKGLVLGK